MSDDKNYIAINKEAWNNKTDIHFNSDFYDNKSFIAGKNSLNEIELLLLNDVTGKSILHLQCHFGQDTISLARMGAKSVGVDLSDRAIERANELQQITNANVRFICCNLYDLPNHLSEKFDIVFTSYGTIGWLPDLDKWANIVNTYLKPGGEFIIAEFHPVLWMFDDDFEKISYNYFNDGPIEETEEGTYADKDLKLIFKYMCWNHSLSEVISSLRNQGLIIDSLDEFDYSPYDCFRHTDKIGDRKYRIKHLGNKMPMVYSLKAVKSH